MPITVICHDSNVMAWCERSRVQWVADTDVHTFSQPVQQSVFLHISSPSPLCNSGSQPSQAWGTDTAFNRSFYTPVESFPIPYSLPPLAPSTLNKGLHTFSHNHVCCLHNSVPAWSILHGSYSYWEVNSYSPRTHHMYPHRKTTASLCWQRTAVIALMSHILLTGHNRLVNYLRNICLISSLNSRSLESNRYFIKMCCRGTSIIRHYTK